MAKTIHQQASRLALHALVTISLALAFAAALPAAAQQGLTIGRSTGLPIPRFVSLDPRQTEVNVRFGPGQQYPINWVFTRSGVPLEIIAEFDNWRKIKDYEGAEGWISARLLTGRRTIMIEGAVRDLRRTADSRARVLLRAEPGVIGELLECREDWCRVEIEGQRGWLLRGEFWGTLPGETVP
ncbi:MAG: SH3 domain-containing protein [Alphaproteobacteria bacterium]|nr:SH3 domain-containing protein [Alphaproteobacteria bacterium]